MHLIWAVALLFLYEVKAGTFTVDYANHQFLKDGKPFRYISGSIHYMRVHPDLWNDRLHRIRALGFNAVQVYVPWNLHEPVQGTFDFSGGMNITNFLSLAQQNGLNVLLRPGPYICAEWEFGGFPWWLLKNDNIQLRTYDQTYLTAIQNYYGKLLDVIQPLLYKNGGPILTIQVENEYGYSGACNDTGAHNYTSFLRDFIWSKVGNDVVLTTVDGAGDSDLTCGAVPGGLATVDFGPQSNDNIDHAFTQQRKYNNNSGPSVCTEYWITWFHQWGDTHPNVPNITKIIGNFAHMYYNWNASFNVYMIHGGTNFDFMNGNIVTTSYDYDGAISENGDITPVYRAIREFIQNLTDWENPPLDVPSNNPATNYGQVPMKQIGTNLISTLTQIQEKCTQSQMAINFEKIDHGYGYVLYTTTLQTGGSNVSLYQVKDIGYIFVNNIFKDYVIRGSNHMKTINAQAGDVLRILVENRGRENGGSGTHNDLARRGLFNVTLDGTPLQNWYQCGINLTKASVDSLTNQFVAKNNFIDSAEKATTGQPGVFVGQFTAAQLTDTFFNSSGWGKGQLFINGYNLGRYWPSEGPQITLYVPKPYIQQTNTVLLIELLGTGQNSVNFVDHAIFAYKNSTN